MKNILNINNKTLEDMLKDFNETRLSISMNTLNKVTEIGIQICKSIFLIPCIKEFNPKNSKDDKIIFSTINNNKSGMHLMMFTSMDKLLSSQKFIKKTNTVTVLNIFDIACILDDFEDIDGIVININNDSFSIPKNLFMDLIVIANETNLIGNREGFDTFYDIKDYFQMSKSNINKYKNISNECQMKLTDYCKEKSYINQVYLIMNETESKNELFVGVSHNEINEDFFNDIELIIKEYYKDIIIRVDNLRSIINKRLVKDKNPIYKKLD